MSVPFHGSYNAEDVTFLLTPLTVPLISVDEKERRIQSGKSHYSEMLSPERPPSERYLSLFYAALERNLTGFARDVSYLAHAVASTTPGPVTLISLARAGTPVGVLLRRLLEQRFGQKDVKHYSVSIIRDRGIDENALLHILGPENRAQNGVVFVDGWTGKGVIQRELKSAVLKFNKRHGFKLSPELFVVADLCGVAGTAATTRDYLIPSSILNASVSGLVSRSILNSDYTGPEDFHGCVYFKDQESRDLSRWFVDTVIKKAMLEDTDILPSFSMPHEKERLLLQKQSTAFIASVMKEYNVGNENHIKPGIGEATRVLLRRTPHLLLLRDNADPDVTHLLDLAMEKNIPVELRPELPYKAVALIKELLP